MRTLNLGIPAHVDAGKTSPTERLLHTAGVTDRTVTMTWSGRIPPASTARDFRLLTPPVLMSAPKRKEYLPHVRGRV